MLEPEETILHQAHALSWDYANDRAGVDRCFLVITTTRLFIMHTRSGLFGPRFEKGAVDIIERKDIRSSRVENGNVLFVETNRSERGYVIDKLPSLSNQLPFLLNASRLLDGQVS
jgi:hypothetical protein